ncbi:MAG: hypothetical protein QOH49_470 [Acidobacteriota bacterium]|nr:hypothetical protein [Acidobacteriota bacterium]
MVVESIGFKAQYHDWLSQYKIENREIYVYLPKNGEDETDKTNSTGVKIKKGNTFKFGVNNRLFTFKIGEVTENSVEVFLNEEK